jgi:hypothetical protein
LVLPVVRRDACQKLVFARYARHRCPFANGIRAGL